MEVEAKFTVRRAAVLDRLAGLPSLAGFALGDPATIEQADTYLDTPRDDISAGGYFCRRRVSDGRTKITLKNVITGGGGLHRRQELEVEVDGDGLTPGDWPASPARDLVVELVGDGVLEPLFELRQRRALRQVRRPGGERGEAGAEAAESAEAADGAEATKSVEATNDVAELSLDRVTVLAAGRQRRFFEVEVELHRGDEDELHALAGALRDEWRLEPQPESKYTRALALLGLRRGAVKLAPGDVRACALLARRDDAYGRRARALLAVHHGRSQVQAAAESGLSERRVRHWATAYRLNGLSVFPAKVLAAAGAGAVGDSGATGGGGRTAAGPDADETAQNAGLDAAVQRPGATAPARPIPSLTFDAARPCPRRRRPCWPSSSAACWRTRKARAGATTPRSCTTCASPHGACAPPCASSRATSTRRPMRPFVEGAARHRPGARRRARPRRLPHQDRALPRHRCPRSGATSSSRCWRAWQVEREQARDAPARASRRRPLRALRRAPARPPRRRPAGSHRPPPIAPSLRRGASSTCCPPCSSSAPRSVWAFDDALAGGDAPLWRYHQLRITGKGPALHAGVLREGARAPRQAADQRGQERCRTTSATCRTPS